MSIKLSVITPSYGQARYLEETIRSVVSQRDQIHEYIVMDGGSTDGSVDIIRKYEKHIDHWVSEKDKGQSDAIQKGFARATGDVICWLNSDDLFLPGALSKVREAFERHPEWDVITGYHVQVDSETRIRDFHRIPGESARAARWGVNHVCQQTCFFRRALYERIGGLNVDLHCVMDTELWGRMFKAGAVWGHVPEFLGVFRVHPMAKGSSWLAEYAREGVYMRKVQPEYFSKGRALKHRVGMVFYRAQQLLSGRHLRASMETRKHRGQRLVDVFGDWVVNP